MSGLGGGLRATNTNTSAHTARIACRAAKESAASGTSRGRPLASSAASDASNGWSGSVSLLPTKARIAIIVLGFYMYYCYCTESYAVHMTWHFFNLFYERGWAASPARRWLWCEMLSARRGRARCGYIYVRLYYMRKIVSRAGGRATDSCLLCAVCQKVSILLLASCLSVLFCTMAFGSRENNKRRTPDSLWNGSLERLYNWFSS